MLTHSMKLCNDAWWIKMMNITKDGGTITWADAEHDYNVKDGKMESTTKRAYRDLKSNTTKDFHSKYMIKFK